ncbi:MAG: Brp/Blh family beta-carotene 15,15'-dioxygenase [Ardenticatenaceae bacterium]|nr:Brp/Blh family beta-carotene 15,15'-dioxygenase [Ardenticatenaceae bacterium]
MLSNAFVRSVLLPGWLLIFLSPFFLLFDINLSPAWQYLPFGVSLIFLGLPHGAIDHLVPGRQTGRPLYTRGTVLFFIGYVALAAVYLLFWNWFPVPSAVFFILLTWFHWGQGDLFFTYRWFNQSHHRSRLQTASSLIIRGGLPMLVPFLAFPEIYLTVFETFTDVFAGSITFSDSGELLPLRLLLSGIFGGLIILYLGYDLVANGMSKSFLVDFLEIVGLSIYFWAVPPILAVGLYFCLWHSLRHIGRLIFIDDRDLRRPVWISLYRFFRESLPLTLVSLLFLVGLYFVVPSQPNDVSGLAGVYLVMIAALTLPHTIVVAWMDRQENDPLAPLSPQRTLFQEN